MRSLLTLALALSCALSIAQSEPEKEVAALRSKAEVATKAIGELASSGKLTTSDEAVQQLKRLVDELQTIRTRLDAIEAKFSGKPVQPKPSPSTIKLSGFTQFQYTDTARKGTATYSVPSDAFRFRRVRLIAEAAPSDFWSAKIVEEVAGGENQSQTQLKEGWAQYKKDGYGVKIGQFAPMLGWDLERSTTIREMPEFAVLSRTYFSGENLRGITATRTEGPWTFGLGAFDSLAIQDPEQAALGSGTGNKLSANAAVRYDKDNLRVGISGLAGKRAAYYADGKASPETDRRFGILDAEWRHVFQTPITLRAELGVGRDRIPSARADLNRKAHDLTSFNLEAAYALNAFDTFAARWDQLDPNTDKGGNVINGYGLTYLRNLNSAIRLSVTYEWTEDRGRAALNQERYHLTTIRLQVRF
jgi:hypothetical protein